MGPGAAWAVEAAPALVAGADDDGCSRPSHPLLAELLEPYRGQRGRVVRLLVAGGIHAPRFGPRMPRHSIARV